MHSKEDKSSELGSKGPYFKYFTFPVEVTDDGSFVKCIKCKISTKVKDALDCIYHDGAKYWPGYHTCCKCLKECVNDR